MKGNRLIIWFLIAGSLHQVIHSKCIEHSMSLVACLCVTTKRGVQKAYTTLRRDHVSLRWTVAKNREKTTAGKRYCRQGKTSFCLTRYLKGSNGCQIVFKVFCSSYFNVCFWCHKVLALTAGSSSFSPKKIVQTCLAVLLYVRVSRPRFVQLFLCLLYDIFFILHGFLSKHHLLRFHFSFSLVILSISRSGNFKGDQPVGRDLK